MSIIKKYKDLNGLFSLNMRADHLSPELLICIATLGLMATTADGDPKNTEISCFVSGFKRKFGLSHSEAVEVVNYALKRILNAEQKKLLQYSCDKINFHLDTDQKIRLVDIISDILVCDGVTTEGEEYYLCYLIYKLNLVGELDGDADQCTYTETQPECDAECQMRLVDKLAELQPD